MNVTHDIDRAAGELIYNRTKEQPMDDYGHDEAMQDLASLRLISKYAEYPKDSDDPAIADYANWIGNYIAHLELTVSLLGGEGTSEPTGLVSIPLDT